MIINHFGLDRQYKNLKEELLEATDLALKDGQLMSGQYTRTFEGWLKRKTKTKYAVTVHSGTQALEIIARYKKKKHQTTGAGNPRIHLPNLTYPATLNAFLTAGWEVELTDTDKNGILQLIDDVTTYDCLMGFAGLRPWSTAMYKESYGIIVDGAQHWLVSDGNVGAGMAISFDPTKNLNASGNGGAIVTNDEQLYLYASNYKDNSKPYFHDVGTNSKMSELDCAQILVRTKYIDDWQKRRHDIANYWCDRLCELPITLMADTSEPHALQKFVIYTSDRDSLHTHLILNNIQSKIHYEYTLGDLPVSKGLVKPDLLSTSVMLSKGVLSLPIYPELTDSEVTYIADTVIEFFKD